VPGPEEAARHSHIGKGLSDAARASVVKHSRDGLLRAPELLIDVLGVAARAFDELHPDPIVEHSTDVGHHAIDAGLFANGDLDVGQ